MPGFHPRALLNAVVIAFGAALLFAAPAHAERTDLPPGEVVYPWPNQPPAPLRISALSHSTIPTEGGTVVAISGKPLDGVTSVTFGGVPATSFTIDTWRRILAVAPPLPAGDALPVTVTSATAASSFPIDVIDPSAVAQFSTPVQCTYGVASGYGGPPATVPATLVSRYDKPGPASFGDSVKIEHLRLEIQVANSEPFTYSAAGYPQGAVMLAPAISISGAAGATSGRLSAASFQLPMTGSSSPLGFAIPSAGTFAPLNITPVALDGAEVRIQPFSVEMSAIVSGDIMTRPTFSCRPTDPAGGVIARVVPDPATFGAPAVDAIAPNSGPTTGGTIVLVTGSGFGEDTGPAPQVDFDGVPATDVTVVADTLLAATSPPHAAADNVAVRVTTAAGTSRDTVVDDFDYVEPPAIDRAFDVSGAATLKSLVTGSVPLKGSLDTTIASGGAVSGDLALDPAVAKLVALGFLPVQATLAFTATAPTTGTLVGGTWASTSKVRIKLPKVSLFGVQIAGGANCQAKAISSIALRSVAPAFDPASGGQLAGTFAISDLSGCGALTGLVSPVTASKSNAVVLTLTARP